MLQRRGFLHHSFLGLTTFMSSKLLALPTYQQVKGKPIVVSTWNEGLPANKGAWEILGKGGRALDAVEAGVKVTEDSINCCVGLGANPDRDGFVTLDASIMDENFNCGGVAF